MFLYIYIFHIGFHCRGFGALQARVTILSAKLFAAFRVHARPSCLSPRRLGVIKVSQSAVPSGESNRFFFFLSIRSLIPLSIYFCPSLPPSRPLSPAGLFIHRQPGRAICGACRGSHSITVRLRQGRREGEKTRREEKESTK